MTAVNAIHVGALFPLGGYQAPLAREEYRGMQIAASFANADGGIAGHPLVLDSGELSSPGQADSAVRALKNRGDQVIVGTYSSALFRRAMLAAQPHVGALIGSTMAECGPELGAALGADAVGVFASDRPTSGFNAQALSGPARVLDQRFTAAWRAQTGVPPTDGQVAMVPLPR